MPKIVLAARYTHPNTGKGNKKGKMNNKAIINVKIILPLVSAVMKATIEIMRTIILTSCS